MATEKIVLSDLEKYEDIYDLAEMMGIELFMRVVALYGGSTIYIPIENDLKKFSRNRNICLDFESGLQVRGLARKYKISKQSIYNILRKDSVLYQNKSNMHKG